MATRWKQFERDIAALFGGTRFWANSGEKLDVESETVVAQCKEVGRMSVAELVRLAEQVEREATIKLKAGVVCVRIKRGPGYPKSPTLVAMTEATWRYMNGAATDGTTETTTP